MPLEDRFWLVKTLQNSREIVEALRLNQVLPPLKLRNGMVLFHPLNEYSTYPEELIKGLNLSILETFQEIFYYRLYVKDDFYWPDPTHVVLDIGIELGFFSVYCHMQAKGIQIHCFEALPFLSRSIEKNAVANQINLKIHPYAVWDKAEKLEIKQSPLSASFFDGLFRVPAGVMQPDIEKVATMRTAIERVGCISLEAAVQIANVEHVDFLKIHVEGAEVEVVTGTPAAVWEKIDRVGVIYHEFIRPGCAEQIISTLQANGFNDIAREIIPGLPIAGVIRAKKRFLR